MRNRRWQLIGAVAAALGVLAFGAGWVLAGDDQPGPGQSVASGDLVFLRRERRRLARHGAPRRAREAEARAARRRQREPKLVYLETDPRIAGAGPDRVPGRELPEALEGDQRLLLHQRRPVGLRARRPGRLADPRPQAVGVLSRRRGGGRRQRHLRADLPAERGMRRSGE